MNKRTEQLNAIDEMQGDSSDLEAKFNAYADSSTDLLNVTKRMFAAGLHKEAGMNAEDYAAYAYCAEQMLHAVIEKNKQMDDLINQDKTAQGAGHETE